MLFLIAYVFSFWQNLISIGQCEGCILVNFGTQSQILFLLCLVVWMVFSCIVTLWPKSQNVISIRMKTRDCPVGWEMETYYHLSIQGLIVGSVSSINGESSSFSPWVQMQILSLSDGVSNMGLMLGTKNKKDKMKILQRVYPAHNHIVHQSPLNSFGKLFISRTKQPSSMAQQSI